MNDKTSSIHLFHQTSPQNSIILNHITQQFTCILIMNSPISFLEQHTKPIDVQTYSQLSKRTLLSNYFDLNLKSPLRVFLSLNAQMLLLNLSQNNTSPQYYSLPLQQGLTYRIISQPQKQIPTISWTLLLSCGIFTLPLQAPFSVSFHQWDNFLKKKIIKFGFHEDFKPIKKLGSGCSAAVFEVQRRKDQRRFAAKTFPKANFIKDPKSYEAFLNEIKIMKKLSEEQHENVIALHQIYQSEGSIYLIVDLASGGNFSSYISLNLQHISQSDVKKILLQILKGLSYIHSKGIAHRDIKPNNLLIRSRQGPMEITIADMGLATLIQEPNYLFTHCGTPGFVAPQILQGPSSNKLISSKCDIFSVGAIFHFLLTGSPLFEGSSILQVLKKNRLAQINFELELYQKLSEKACSLLKGMLAIDPNDRLSSEDALSHRFFCDQIDIKIQSPGATIMTSNFLQTTQEISYLKLQMAASPQVLPRKKKGEYRKASQQ